MKGIFSGLLLTVILGVAAPAVALPIPSKTAPGQSLADREAELAVIRSVLGREEVARALAGHGFTADEIEQRLARLSPDEVHAMASQIDQLQAAGIDVPRYIWIMLAVFLGVLIATAIF